MSQARPEQGLHQLVRFVGVSQGVQPLLTLGVSIIIARILGPEGRGAYGLVVTTVSVLPLVLGLGLTHAVRYWAASGRADRHALVLTATALGVGIGAVAAAIVYAAWATGRPDWLVPPGLGALGGAIFAAVIFAAVLRGFWLNYLAGLERYGYATFGVNVASALQLLALVVLWQLGLVSVEAAVGALGVQFLFTFALFPVMARQDLRGPGGVARLPLSELRSMFRFARWQYVSSLLMQTNMRINIYMLFALKGEYDTGLYTAVLGPASFLGLAASPFSLVLTARTARRTDDPEFPRRVAGALRLMTLIMGLGAAAAAAVGPWVLPLLFGEEFRAAATTFAIMLPGVIAHALVVSIAQYLQGAGRPDWNTRVSGVGAVLTVALNLLLIPPLGASGAALANLIAFAVALVVSLYAFLVVSDLHLRDLVVFRRSDWEPLRRVLGLGGP